ncbi:MAG TPA: hypothetical protein VGO68_13405 [Pyrinomonadaceae bacterium]|jgi:hypothetical protein|nr:hypothetical protein [Pyrinomonadaceae bacterium]
MARRILVFTLLVLALVFLGWTPRPQRAECALPACSSERVFYTDGSFTTITGDYFVSCYSGVIHSGHSSCYYRHYEYGPCTNGSCSDVDFECSNGTITDSTSPTWIGLSCACYPVF